MNYWRIPGKAYAKLTKFEKMLLLRRAGAMAIPAAEGSKHRRYIYWRYSKARNKKEAECCGSGRSRGLRLPPPGQDQLEKAVPEVPSRVVFCVTCYFRLHHLQFHLRLRVRPPQPDPLPRLLGNGEDKDARDFAVSSFPPFAYATARLRTTSGKNFSMFAPPSSTSGSHPSQLGVASGALLPPITPIQIHVELSRLLLDGDANPNRRGEDIFFWMEGLLGCIRITATGDESLSALYFSLPFHFMDSRPPLWRPLSTPLSSPLVSLRFFSALRPCRQRPGSRPASSSIYGFDFSCYFSEMAQTRPQPLREVDNGPFDPGPRWTSPASYSSCARAAAPSSSSPSLVALQEGGCRARAGEHRGGHTVQPGYGAWGCSGWASGGKELPPHDLRDPTGHRYDVAMWSALHALLEDVACRVQLLTRRNSPIVPHSPTRPNLHDTPPFDEQRGREQRPMGAVQAQWPNSSISLTPISSVFLYERLTLEATFSTTSPTFGPLQVIW
ncbi:hypothetical protein K438DRAFT_2074051 [Mycena galopus ATCC 62051]|nr:hypothetical protein K438DRAFT_2074051 [Mycena galopus ATCC 62051]